MPGRRTNIGILDSDFKRDSAKSLFKEAKKRGKAERLDLHDICLVGDKTGLSFLHNTTHNIDVVLPRFSTWMYNFGMIAMHHLETQGIPVVNGSKCIELSQNKYYTSLALKKKKIMQPNFAIALSSKNLKKHISKMVFPVVLKLLHGTEGVGTMKASNWSEVRDWVETLGQLKQSVYIQEYLPHKEDYRLFIVGNQVIYGYKKVIAENEWKSNTHYGAKVEPLKITNSLRNFGLKCHNAVKAEVSAVDFAMVNDEPSVLEINQAPDFTNSLSMHKNNVAQKIIDFAVRKARR